MFKYLGIVLSEADDDWPSVIRNLTKARAVWRIMTRILSRGGVRLGVSGFLFKSVVQSDFILGAETRLVSPRMGRVLGDFQDQAAQLLKGRLPWR